MDRISKERRSENMRRIKSTDTKPELTVRRLVRSLKAGYRLHRKDIPGKPDLAFIGRKKAIFVHGCFWHQHPDPACKIARMPKSRSEYWGPKLLRNVERDGQNQALLTEAGWDILVVWECQTKDIDRLSERLQVFLG
ncbi:very short patch repair endonuclease [Hoeflea sp.]|uniref:very short patch repair endonuclease n=1 Tax=Hoeflea sp. TaxID=1940281 RepID=UPI003B02D5BA